MRAEIEQAECADCGLVFPDSVQGARRDCPECGSNKRVVSLNFTERFVATASAEGQSTRLFDEHNRLALAAVITASVGGPLLGFWLVGWPGVLVGLFLGGLGFFLGPYAVTKVKEIRR